MGNEGSLLSPVAVCLPPLSDEESSGGNIPSGTKGGYFLSSKVAGGEGERGGDRSVTMLTCAGKRIDEALSG